MRHFVAVSAILRRRTIILDYSYIINDAADAQKTETNPIPFLQRKKKSKKDVETENVVGNIFVRELLGDKFI